MTDRNRTRSYRSALRSEQAASTRSRVLAAAAECFAEKGYAGTSLPAIAERAGVSPETVKANGPKRELLLGAFEQAFAGVESREPLSAAEPAARLLAIAAPEEFLAATADFVAQANARTSALWTEFLSAAGSDPAVAEALDGLLERRRGDYRSLTGALRERGVVRDDGDPREQAATLSFLWSPESHQQLVTQSGWSMRRYREWLMEAVRRQLG